MGWGGSPGVVGAGSPTGAVGAGVQYVQRQTTNYQVKFLAEALSEGRVSAGKLRGEMEKNAVKEMSKGADKLLKQSRPLTVDGLLEEYHSSPDFKRLAERVGLEESWFVALAEQKIRRRRAE